MSNLEDPGTKLAVHTKVLEMEESTLGTKPTMHRTKQILETLGTRTSQIQVMETADQPILGPMVTRQHAVRPTPCTIATTSTQVVSTSRGISPVTIQISPVPTAMATITREGNIILMADFSLPVLGRPTIALCWSTWRRGASRKSGHNCKLISTHGLVASSQLS